jgi:hypothetical protein
LHGHSNPVSAAVHKVQDKYVGRCRIKQTDFGIQPVNAGGGLVKVKNELEIEFTVKAAGSAANRFSAEGFTNSNHRSSVRDHYDAIARCTDILGKAPSWICSSKTSARASRGRADA